jgi:YVTN family beta-propeller protein
VAIQDRGVPRTDRKMRGLLGSVSLGFLLALASNCAWAQSAPDLYVTNQGNGTVSVVDPTTNTIVSTFAGLGEP